MQNDFEKQVREKMEELNFVPSAPVWDKVEEQIRQKKDRRRAFIWMPLLGLLLAGGIWWMNDARNDPSFSASHKKPDHSPLNTTTKKNIHQETQQRSDKISKPASASIPTSESLNQSKSRKEPTHSENPVKENISSGTKSSQGSDRKFVPNDLKNAPIIATSKTKNSGRIAIQQNGNTIRPSGKSDPADSRIPVPLPGRKIFPYQPARKIELNTEIPYRNYRYTTEQKAISPVVFHPVVSNVLTGRIVDVVSVKSSRKWELGFALSAGVSGAKSGLNFLGENKRMDAAPMASSFQPPFSYNSNTSTPNTIRNNFAFSAGVAARKPISRRFGISTGILYEYMSTLTNVGVRINQANAVQGSFGNALYYTSYTTIEQEYFNQYHFITLPVSFDYQLLKRQPLRIHAGLSVKQLIRTNALQFNHQSQIYYYNRNAFNRTQLFPGFGIEYAFLKNRSLVIGPQVEGGLVSLEKNGSNEHLFTGSVKAQWFFLKK